jgi:alpha-1,2-mannosyltransferase
MLKQTDSQSFNNQYRGILAQGKKVYLYVLIQLYKLCGNFADLHATNSSWTHNHITEMWGTCTVTKIYPPCDTSDIMEKVSLDKPRKNILVSFAQFRPEKQHSLQLEIWKEALLSLPKDSKFVMVGATRGKDDEEIVE